MNELDELLAAIEREVRRQMLIKWIPCELGGTREARIHKIATNIIQISGVRGDTLKPPDSDVGETGG